MHSERDAKVCSDRLRMDDSDSGTGTDGLWSGRDGDSDPALEYRGYCYTEYRWNSIPFRCIDQNYADHMGLPQKVEPYFCVMR